ncbi:MAG: S8 family peptidase [bacterium]|nr:S8 family peptidase [bacterium]
MKKVLIVLCFCIAAAALGKPTPVATDGEPYYAFVPNHVLVAFSKSTAQTTIDEIIAGSGGKVGSYSKLLDFYRVEVPTGAAAGVRYFRAQNAVLWANYNYLLTALMVPNDNLYTYQWHYPLIGLEQAWDLTQGDPSVKVAVLDQGFQFDHEDMAGVQTVSGYDWIDEDNDPSEPDLVDSHGMHVSGTIFARTNNNTGIAGIAPNCRLMPVRVLDNSGSGSSEAIANGFAWAAQQGAQIVNASLGFPNQNNQPPVDPGQPLSGAIQQCAAAGVVLCVASGNDNADYVSYPAAYPACISVGATAIGNAIAPYSNAGSELDVCAPGGNTDQDLNQDSYVDGVLSTVRDNTGSDYYVFWQGTSMATPHVAGVAALLMSRGCPAHQVRNALQNTALDLGPAGWDVTYGHGRISALAALQYDWSGGGGETVLFDGPMESNNEGWTVREDGNDGVGWRFLDFGSADCGNAAHGGQNGIWHDDEQSVGLLDDWLFTPEISVPANATAVTFSFWQRNCFVTPQYYDLHAIYYSTDGEDFTLISELDDAAQNWEQISVDAAALAGEDVYFAWRYRGDYATEWFLDDVQVTAVLGTDADTRADLTIPMAFVLEHAYPNPFNAAVQIPFAVNAARELSLEIYNLAGQKVATLFEHTHFAPGAQRVHWQADGLASGVYLVKLSSGKQMQTQKILLVK